MWSFFKHHNWPKFNCFDRSAKSGWSQKLHYHCSGSAPRNDHLHCAVPGASSADIQNSPGAAEQKYNSQGAWPCVQPLLNAQIWSHLNKFVAQPGPAALSWSWGLTAPCRGLSGKEEPFPNLERSPLLHDSCSGNSLFSWPYGLPHHASEIFGEGDNCT